VNRSRMNSSRMNNSRTRSRRAPRRVWPRAGLQALVCALAAPLALAAVMPSGADAQAHQHAIANALAQAAQVQTSVSDYRQRTNAFPANNAEAMLKPPLALASADVKSISVRDAGVIEVTLTASSGVDDGVIVLTPQLPKTANTGPIEWRCVSPSYSTIADMTGGNCEYSKLP